MNVASPTARGAHGGENDVWESEHDWQYSIDVRLSLHFAAVGVTGRSLSASAERDDVENDQRGGDQ
jgi:hypothetical protein